jgi:uncharacterized membrane protein
VDITIDGVETSHVDISTLAPEEKREDRVSFIPQLAGENQKVEFHLYKNGEDKPYFDDPLHLYIDVVTFYVLNSEGKAGEYPQQVKQGEPVEVIVGIVNHEYEVADYMVEIKIGGVCVQEANTGTLSHRDKWEQKVSFTPWLCGDGQKVEFWLYKNGSTEPYHKEPLYFSIDVVCPYWPAGGY